MDPRGSPSSQGTISGARRPTRTSKELSVYSRSGNTLADRASGVATLLEAQGVDRVQLRRLAGRVVPGPDDDEVVVHDVETLDNEALGANFSSDGLWWTSSTSASPLRAKRMAWPVPTATTRTWIPIFFLNRGRMWSNSPEF